MVRTGIEKCRGGIEHRRKQYGRWCVRNTCWEMPAASLTTITDTRNPTVDRWVSCGLDTVRGSVTFRTGFLLVLGAFSVHCPYTVEYALNHVVAHNLWVLFTFLCV